MSPPRTYLDYLEDLLDAADKADQFVAEMDFEKFVRDDKTAFAVVRALEVIGEAAKKIPASVRARYPQVPWREMAGIRDKLIHEYFGVNPAVVWKTVREDIPLPKSLVTAIWEVENPQSDSGGEKRYQAP